MIIKTILFLALDLLSKLLITKTFNLHDTLVVIKSFFHITYVKNTGAAFSMLSGKTYLLIIVSLTIIIGLIIYLIKNHPKNKFEQYGYSLIIGGSLGNLLERLFLGYVTDFLDFRIFGYHYPIFNLADTFIFIGVVLIIIDTWRCKK